MPNHRDSRFHLRRCNCGVPELPDRGRRPFKGQSNARAIIRKVIIDKHLVTTNVCGINNIYIYNYYIHLSIHIMHIFLDFSSFSCYYFVLFIKYLLIFS